METPPFHSRRLPPDSAALFAVFANRFEALAPEHREDALLQWVSVTLEMMHPHQIIRVRAEYLRGFGPRASVLDLIDGHLALREIASTEGTH